MRQDKGKNKDKGRGKDTGKGNDKRTRLLRRVSQRQQVVQLRPR